jgi:hypothetical protein
MRARPHVSVSITAEDPRPFCNSIYLCHATAEKIFFLVPTSMRVRPPSLELADVQLL